MILDIARKQRSVSKKEVGSMGYPTNCNHRKSLLVIFSMSSRERGRITSSCYWIDGDTCSEQDETYPDKFAVKSTAMYDTSNLEYILASSKGEKDTDNYKLRCCLFKSTVDRIESVVNSEIEHTTGRCVSLVKAFVKNVLV